MSRPTLGWAHVDSVAGSREAKRRLKVILQVTSGERPLGQAAARLGISPTRFWQLRARALGAAVESLEAGAPGRPPKRDPESMAQVRELERELAEASWELEAARVREEIALVMPRYYRREAPAPARKKGRASRDGQPVGVARRRARAGGR